MKEEQALIICLCLALVLYGGNEIMGSERFSPAWYRPVPEHQPDSILDQPSPDQNKWYPILDTTKNARIIVICVTVMITDETLEIRLTIDGETYTRFWPATGSQDYWVYLDASPATMTLNLETSKRQEAFVIEGRSVKIEIRKTTDNGSGSLQGCVGYAKW